jgi:carboxynorspermidine decarboxylase
LLRLNLSTITVSMRKYSFDDIPSPSYVLEEVRLIENLEILQKVERESGAKILCALKGFAFWKMFPLMKQYVHGATASSLFEAKLIKEEWGSKAHLCCPVYIEKDFEEIISIGSHITFNSLAQYNRFWCKAQDKGLSLGLRINPEYSEIETDLYNPASPDSRLGIRNLKELPDGVEGLHFHVLCENDSYTLARVLDKVEEQFESLLYKVKWVNMGGGHHITKEGYDVDHLIQVIKRFSEKYDVQVILEPGEAFGWQTGFLLSTVQDIIKGETIDTAILDVSFTAHMPDCLEMPYKPGITVRSIAKEHKKYRLGGLSCLAGDFVGDYNLRELSVGDQVIFEDMMHYTMVKTTMFNGVNLPNIGFVRKRGDFQLLSTYGYMDYKEKLS